MVCVSRQGLRPDGGFEGGRGLPASQEGIGEISRCPLLENSLFVYRAGKVAGPVFVWKVRQREVLFVFGERSRPRLGKKVLGLFTKGH